MLDSVSKLIDSDRVNGTRVYSTDGEHVGSLRESLECTQLVRNLRATEETEQRSVGLKDGPQVLLAGHLWAEESVQMAIPWLAMTGVFLSVRRGTMIRVDFFFEKIPLRFQGLVAKLGYVVNIGVLLGMAWASLDFVMQFGGDVALYMEIPVGWSTSALVWGAAGAAMAYTAELHATWRNRDTTGGTVS